MDPFLEYIESRRQLVTKTIGQLESLTADFKEELSDLDAAMKVRIRMGQRPAPQPERSAPPLERLAGGAMASVSSITEMASPDPAVVVPEDDKPAERQQRPIGIPSNWGMVDAVLKASDRPMTAPEIRLIVQRRWWPDGMPITWEKCIYSFVAQKRLVKNGTFFALPPVASEAPRPSAAPAPSAPKPSAPIKAPVPQARPAPPAKAAPAKAPPAPQPESVRRMFEYGGKEAQLSPREWRIVTKLHAVMGHGMIDFKPLADHGLGPDGGRSDPRLRLSEVESTINAKLKPLGVQMVAVPVMPGGKPAGYVLREVS